MPKITKQFTKFIFPFHFNKDLISPESAQIENKKGVKFNIFERFSQKCESLREGLDLLLDENGGTTKIADCYKLNINCRKEFLLPPRKNEYIDFISRQADSSTMRVALPEIKLYFFESDVGFAELEFEYETDSIDDYLNLNYFICEAKSDKNHFISHEKIWNNEKQENEIKDNDFTMQSLLEKLFSTVSLGQENAIVFSYKKVKPIIYSYILVDEKPQELNELLSHLAKNYKQSYKFDDSCTSIQTLHPFENSYWTTSLNGTINISFLTGDTTTDEFFAENFYSKTKDTYFFLFLNVLHQRYAISHIMGKMGQLDRLVNDYYIMEEQLKLARRYSAEATNLKFRAFFKCPSAIEHINNYYDMIYDAFQVGAFYDNFTTDIDNLKNVCSSYVDRIKERDEKFKKRKAAKIEIFVSIFGFIVAEVTLFNNSWSLIEKVLGHSISFWSPVILILFATLLSPLISIILNVKKQSNEIKLLTKQIDTEEDSDLVENDKMRIKKGRRIEKLRKKNRKMKKHCSCDCEHTTK